MKCKRGDPYCQKIGCSCFGDSRNDPIYINSSTVEIWCGRFPSIARAKAEGDEECNRLTNRS